MNEFEKYAREQLNSHPSPVDTERLWGNIDAGLHRKKHRLAFWWTLGASLLVVSGAAGFYFFEKKLPVPGASDIAGKQHRVAEMGAPAVENNTAIAPAGAIPAPIAINLRADCFSKVKFEIGNLKLEKWDGGFSPVFRVNTPTNDPTPESFLFQFPISNFQFDFKKSDFFLKLMAMEVGGGVAQPEQTPQSFDLMETAPGPRPETPNPEVAAPRQLQPAITGSGMENGMTPKTALLTPIPTLQQQLDAPPRATFPLPNPVKTGCADWRPGRRFSPYFGLYGGVQYPVKSVREKNAAFADMARKRRETETVLEGLVAGAYAGMKHRGGIFAEGGLEYNQINERFDQQLFLRDTIGKINVIGIIINAPGDTTFIQDSAHVLRETRTVRRVYNDYRLLQIPLAIGFEWQRNVSWSLYGKAGVAINVQFAQNAQLLNPEGIAQKYNSRQPGPGHPFRTNIGLVPFVNAGVRYRVVGQLSLFGEVRYAHPLREMTADDYPLRQRYGLPGLNIGVHVQW